MRYLGTSLRVSALTGEVATDRILSWLTRHGSADPTISDWVVTESASALSRSTDATEAHTAGTVGA